MTVPYFYIIKHLPSNRQYAGAKWGRDADPTILLKPDGYLTSSNKIKSLIDSDGLESFEILEIVTEFNDKHPYDYETNFLVTNRCAESDIWINGHNNHLFSLGTPEYVTYMLKNYGATHASKCPEIVAKQKNTNLIRYGCEYVMGSSYFRIKSVETFQQRYNVINPSQIPDWSDKCKTTLFENYGVNHNSQIDSVKLSKINKSNEKYGTNNVSQSDIIKKKKQDTFMDRYGVSSPFDLPGMREKQSATSKLARLNDPIITCPHCSIAIKGKGVFNRWHGDNCKLKI